MASNFWTGVAVTIQSALAAGDTMTAISKANPGVVTSTAHGISDTNFVVLKDVQGMHQVNGRVFRVTSSATNTFALEGEDTSSYDTFTSGTAYVVTFGTSLTVARGLTASGGSFNFIDTTTIHEQVRTQVPGQAEPATYTFTCKWDASDTGLIALKAASQLKAERCVKFTFSTGQIMVFNGYIGATLLPTGSAGDLVETEVVITAYGTPTYYSS